MHSNSRKIPIVLTIAGSDSSGGAGIQADIKTLSATGSYACSVITSITSQNTKGVQAVIPIPLKHIESQIDSVFNDLNITAVKIGMLGNTDIIQLVARKLTQYAPKIIVLDPVMVATSGDLLLETGAITTLISKLLPLATVITPNIPEAFALIKSHSNHVHNELAALFVSLKTLPTSAILLKGGHMENDTESMDWLITHHSIQPYHAQRIKTNNTHGTGCTLSSAIASYLAQGHDLHHAILRAKHYIQTAIMHADDLDIGHGKGPVHHFYALYQQTESKQ